MKTLIYTVAHGDDVFRAMARECEHSARRHGYAGEFRILTEDPPPPSLPGSPRPDARPERLAKASLIRVLSAAAMASYDKILFVDADCLFRKNPAALFAGEGLRFATEGPGPIPLYNTVFLSLEERLRFRRCGMPRVNSGTILMPGHLAHGFLAAWEAFWRACPRRAVRENPMWRWCNPALMDQPALQALLFRRPIAWAPFPAGTIGFPVYAPEEDTALVHFCGPRNGGTTSPLENKREVLREMRDENQGRADTGSGTLRTWVG